MTDVTTPNRLLTGDIATRSPDGLYRIVGRSARFVKPFGIRVGLDDAQAIAGKFVASAVCVGNDEHIVVAVTEADADTNVARAIDALVRHFSLPPFVFLPLTVETMPLLPSGKIDQVGLLHAGLAATVAAPPSPQADGSIVFKFLRRFRLS